MNIISWGIIGCGNVAEVKSGPAFQKCNNSELLAVMRRDAAKAEDFAQRHKVLMWTTDAEAVFDNEKITAVYIATPPSSHIEFTLKAIAAGKNIYLEKPITLNVAEALQIEEALKNSTSKLVVAHYRRKLPAFLKVKGLLEQNAIGNIQLAELKMIQPNKIKSVTETKENWRLNPEISGGGYFYDLAPHQLDLMIAYFGKPNKIAGFAANQSGNYKANDMVNGIMSFKNNIQFCGIWAFNSGLVERKEECIIYGDKGSIQFSFFGNQVKLKTLDEEKFFNFEKVKHVQQPMIQSTVDYFLGKMENPCTLEDGIEVMRIMEAFTKP
jgi:predicted dehydrogenase